MFVGLWGLGDGGRGREISRVEERRRRKGV